MNQPSQAITEHSQANFNNVVGTNQQTFSVPVFLNQHLSNSATEQALCNTITGTFPQLVNSSIATEWPMPNLALTQSKIVPATAHSHSSPSSNFVSAQPQSNQSSVSNAGRFIQTG